jgi:tetratricopeptide (TPR) repeat protein
MKLFLAGLLLAGLAAAQSSDNFDDLAHRAEVALDSNPAEAATLYKQALDQRPAWPEGWFYLGGAQYRLSRYAEAVDAFHKGLDLSPSNGTAWAFVGLAEYELGHLDTALNAIGKGEQIGLGSNVGFETAVRQRAAMILIHSSLFDQAMSQLQPLAKHQQSPAAVVEAVGLCALAIATDPAKLPESRRKIVDAAGQAMWAATSQRPKDAEDGFRKLLADYPNEPGVHYAFGLYLMDTDQHSALEQFEKELSINPTHWPTLLVTAFLKTREGSPEVAARELLLAMRRRDGTRAAGPGSGGQGSSAIRRIREAATVERADSFLSRAGLPARRPESRCATREGGVCAIEIASGSAEPARRCQQH